MLSSNTIVKVRGGTETVAQSTPISVEQVAEAVRMNPNYVEDTPVCFGSCWSGSSGTAQQLANQLGAPVYAPTRPVSWDRTNNTWVQDTKYVFGNYDIKPEWKMFYPVKK